MKTNKTQCYVVNLVGSCRRLISIFEIDKQNRILIRENGNKEARELRYTTDSKQYHSQTLGGNDDQLTFGKATVF